MKKSGIIIAATIFYLICSINAMATEAKLISAAKSGNIKIIRDLISQGFSRETSDSSGKSLLLIAASNL